MTRDELDALVLLEVARRCAAIEARPKPPAWRPWEARLDAEDREYGPRYMAGWFGDLAADEAGRQRLLRTVYRLFNAGLLMITKSASGCRLQHVKVTAEGKKTIAEIGKRRPRGKGSKKSKK